MMRCGENCHKPKKTENNPNYNIDFKLNFGLDHKLNFNNNNLSFKSLYPENTEVR